MSFASSCSIDNQVPLTVDLDVEISQSDTKMILPAGGIDATKITVYKLSGKGPNGETFNWRSNTNGKFKVFGISQGYWVLTAEGYSANGTKIANGTANVYLNDANTKVSIILNTLSGNGTAQVTVRWNTKLVPSSAYLELQLKPINGSYVKKSFKSNSNGVAVWEENLPAGSYVVSVMLYETNAKTKVVGGTKDALRVVADNLSSGDITLTIGEVVDLTSSVVDNFGEPITISLTPANNTAVTIGFSTILKSTLTKPVSGVTYKWYEDGVLIANANAANYTYAPTTVGRHTLTVVAKAPYVDQVGSASVTIIALKNGGAVVKDSVTLTNNIVYSNYNKNVQATPSSWGGNTGTVEYKTTDGQNGGYSKILKPITEGSGGIYQDVRTNLKPPVGTKYYASCYLKASATPGATSGYNLSFNSVESNTYYPYSGVRWGINEWVKNSFVFTVSKNNETLQERSIIYSHNAGISFMYSNYVLIDLSRTTSKNGKPFLEILADSGYKIDEEIAKYLDNLPYFKDEYVLGCG